MRTGKHTLVKLDDDLYVAWSSVVDAPVAVGTRAEVEAGLQRDIDDAREALAHAEGRLARLDQWGHTAYWTTKSPRSYVAGNRAGDDETELSWDDLLASCREWLAERSRPEPTGDEQ